jgi:hypothetical protein
MFLIVGSNSTFLQRMSFFTGGWLGFPVRSIVWACTDKKNLLIVVFQASYPDDKIFGVLFWFWVKGIP